MTERFMTESQVVEYQRKRSGVQVGDVANVRLVLPMPPSVNSSGADSHRGGRKTWDYKEFMARVAAIVAEVGNPRIEGRLSVDVLVVPSDWRKFDLDNLLKALLDALAKAGVFRDDSQIDDLRIRRMPAVVGCESSVTVTITRIAGAT